MANRHGWRRVVLLALTANLAFAGNALANDSTVTENQRKGDERWHGTAANGAILAYSSQPSVKAGQALDFFVKTADPTAAYRVEIHRIGWYGGSGGRRVACYPVDCTSTIPGAEQSNAPIVDSTTGEYRANWTNPLSIQFGSSWASGYYMVEFILKDEPLQFAGPSMRVPVIVRSPQPRSNSLLLQAPTNTWQAYNKFGGRSLYPYTNASGTAVPQARVISYDRPYGSETGNGGTSSWLRYEIQAIKFVEREGHEIEYTTNVDVDREPGSLLKHRAVVSVGHDEYWTVPIFNAFSAARDAGVNLVFLGSNNAYWNTRLEGGGRTLVAYKERYDLDPGSPKTGRIRQLPGMDECQLLGVRWNGGWNKVAGGEIVDRDYTVTSAGAAHPWMKAAGFFAGEVLDKAVGYEWDSRLPGCRTEATTLFEHIGTADGDADKGWTGTIDDTRYAHATVYTAASGARVFSSGSMQFNLFLDGFRRAAPQEVPAPNPKVQRFVDSMLDELNSGVPVPAAVTPTPTPTTTPTTPPAPKPAAPQDREAPALTVRVPASHRVVAGRSLKLDVGCDETCKVVVRGRFRGLARPTVLARAAAAPKTTTLAVKLSAATVREVRKALGRGRKVSLALTITATDASGNAVAASRTVRLKR